MLQREYHAVMHLGTHLSHYWIQFWIRFDDTVLLFTFVSTFPDPKPHCSFHQTCA